VAFYFASSTFFYPRKPFLRLHNKNRWKYVDVPINIPHFLLCVEIIFCTIASTAWSDFNFIVDIMHIYCDFGRPLLLWVCHPNLKSLLILSSCCMIEYFMASHVNISISPIFLSMIFLHYELEVAQLVLLYVKTTTSCKSHQNILTLTARRNVCWESIINIVNRRTGFYFYRICIATISLLSFYDVDVVFSSWKCLRYYCSIAKRGPGTQINRDSS